MPFQIREVGGEHGIERVRLFHSVTEEEVEIDVDAVLLQLGFKTAPRPARRLGL